MAKKPKKHTREELDRAAEQLMNHYQGRRNVTGADVGFIWRDGKKTKEIGIRIHVKHKAPLTELESTEVFPSEFEGIPLDVISGDYSPGLTSLEADERATLPLLIGGVSCGPIHQGAGTLGAIVIDEISGQPSILSNWHVLVGPNGVPGAPITQAATLDNGNPQRDVVAQLGRSILDRDGDAALAPLNGTRPWLPVVNGDYDQLTTIRDSMLGETLTKSGRSTGTTQGVVDGEGMYRITYEVSPGRFEERTIKGFKLVPKDAGNPNNEEISRSGDSGSIWYHPSSKAAVGLHFAGETNSAPAQEHAIACNMSAVQNRLQFRMATYDDLIQAIGEAQRQGGAASGRAHELTPHPDWPTPVWPWWPIPIDGPWIPWPVRAPRRSSGPLGPVGPQAPSFGRPARAIGGIDLSDPRDFAVSVLGGLPTGIGPGLESVQAIERVSVNHDIWPALKSALVAYGYPDAVGYTPQTNTSVLATVGNPGTVLRIVIRQSNVFWNDGIRVHSADLRNLPRFIDVLFVLAKAYEDLEFEVVA